MTSLISFSLWGNAPMYCVGAQRNIDLAKRFFPGWSCRVYVGEDVPAGVRQDLAVEGAEVVAMQSVHSHDGLLWRFLPAGDPKIDIMISRDCDSRIGPREAAAVAEWLASDKDFHIMRDHPFHGAPILGGTWGCRNGLLRDMAELIARWSSFAHKGCDQEFLAAMVYPRVIGRAFEHSEFGLAYGGATRPFPVERRNFEFVGEIFNAEDVRGEEWRIIRDWLSASARRQYLRRGEAR